MQLWLVTASFARIGPSSREPFTLRRHFSWFTLGTYTIEDLTLCWTFCIFKLDLLFKVSSADLSSPCVSAMHLRGDWCVADVLSAGGELSTTTTWAPHQLASSSHYSQQQLPPRLEQQSPASAKGHLHSHSQRQSNNNLGKSLHLKRPFHFRCAQWIGLQIW